MSFFSRDFGTTLVLQLSKYPRMRLKRDLLFGFTDVLGTYFHMYMTVREVASPSFELYSSRKF
jgi:hypothetical protein